MTTKLTSRRSLISQTALVVGALILTGGLSLAAERVTSDQILRALSPKKPLTRGLSLNAPQQPDVSAAEGRFIDSLRDRSTRSLSLGERDQIASIAGTKPNIDLDITFEHNSAVITGVSQQTVRELGKALTAAELKGSTFVLAGHTDGKGGEDYNQDLSERRADAIKRYLSSQFGIPGTDLVTVGYGKARPKDTRNPMDPSNRRVQIVNIAGKAVASQ